MKNQQHENNKVGQNVLQEEPSTFVWKSSGGAPSEEEWEGEHHCGSPKEDSEFFWKLATFEIDYWDMLKYIPHSYSFISKGTIWIVNLLNLFYSGDKHLLLLINVLKTSWNKNNVN